MPILSRRNFICGSAALAAMATVPAVAATGIKTLSNGKTEIDLAANTSLASVGAVVELDIKEQELQNQIKVYLMDFDNLTEPITGLKFDRILFLESIGYSINRRKLLENCRKLLKTDGKLFIRTPTFCDVATPQDYQHNNYLIKIWKYNFSTLNCIINDLYNEKYTQIQYIAFNKMLCNFFINPSDIYNTYQFNKINNLDLINLDVYLTPSTSVMSIIMAS